MATITRKYLEDRIARINETRIKGEELAIGYTGAPRKARVHMKGESVDISPRLSKSALSLWLDGYEAGANYTHKALSPEKKFDEYSTDMAQIYKDNDEPIYTKCQKWLISYTGRDTLTKEEKIQKVAKAYKDICSPFMREQARQYHNKGEIKMRGIDWRGIARDDIEAYLQDKRTEAKV